MHKKIVLRVNRGLAFLTILSQLVFIGGPVIQYASAEELPVDSQVELQTDVLPSEPVVTEEVMTEPVVEEPAEPVATEEVATEPIVVEPIIQESAPAETAPVNSPELTTDKADYLVGEVATIFGKFFQSVQNLVLKIFGSGPDGNDYTETTQNITADDQGSFTTTYTLDNIFRPLYTVTANSTEGMELARTTFTDANPATDISQCQNGGVGDPLQPCSETAPFAAASGYGYEGNAAANSSNSHWTEGDFVPLRIVATNYSAGVGYIDFSIDVTKGGKHAYDYVGSFDQTETTGATAGSHFNHNNPVGDIIVGADPTVPADSTGTVPLAALDPFPVACGSNIFTGPQTPGLINAWGTSGNLTVSYISQNVGSSDCTTRIRVAWTGTKIGFGGKIVIAYAAHIAKQADWGTGNSAINISGSPYHSSLVERSTGGDVKGIGNQDAKLSASAIVIPNTITIHKTMVGGTDTFTFTGTPNGTISEDGGILTASPPNGAGSVTESVLSGWSLTVLSCTVFGGATRSTNLSTRTASYTMPSTGGGIVDCTFTNTLQQGTLTVIKHVVNDNGGGLTASNFTLHVKSGGTDVAGSPAAGSESGTSYSLNAGTYVVSENTPPTGYTQLTGFGTDCDSSGNVTVVAGQTKTCTITNDDVSPQLIVIKHVINDNGGTLGAADFTMNVTATNPSDDSFPGAESPGTTITLDAGAYSVAEPAVAGYATSYSTDCTGTAIIGQIKTCTVTNNDIAPKLHLRKIIDNGNGGTATVADFTLTANGAGSNDISGTSPVDSGATLIADTWALSETSPAGYTASDWVCVGGNQSGSNITLAINEEATCTITNNDIAPSLTLDKITNYTHGGTAPESSWTLTADGGSAGTLSGLGAIGHTDVVSDATFQAGIYALSESNAPTGYTNGISYSCVKNGGAPVSGNSIALAVGDTAVCSITNTDIAPQLIIIKHVINDDGDVAQASDFTMHLTGSNLSNNDFAGSESGITVTLNAGSYSANETNSNGYMKTLSADCSGTIAVGETKTCTITNNDIPHATRTQGFWQTHTIYTSGIFNSITGGLTIGTHTIDNTLKLFAGFYAGISKTSLGAKRSAIDQARMQMLQQWLAAELNCKAFGCSGTTQTLLTNAVTAWAGTNTNLIQLYASQLDTYNNSNDALPISGQGKATPKDSQFSASSQLIFWNILP